MTIELLVNVVARGAIGFFSAIVLSFLIWRMTGIAFNTLDLSVALFFLVQALIVGGSAAIPTAFAWWNTQSSRRIQLTFFVIILVTAVVSAWLVNEIRGVETHYALVRGVLRVQVLSRSYMFIGMISGAALAGNAVGAALYIYRALRYRET